MSNTQLIQLYKAGNIDAVRSLIADKADVNVVTDDSAPLLLAIEANNLSLIDVLLQAGANPACVSDMEDTALMIAAQCGYLEGVHYLLRHQPAALLDARDIIGQTALLIALRNRHLAVASALLDAGADVTARDDDGSTALMVCSDVDMARRLLDLGVDVNARDVDGDDAFSINWEYDFNMAHLLISRGARGYARSTTVFVCACIMGFAEMVKELLKDRPPSGTEDAEWNNWFYTRETDGTTALHFAVDDAGVVQVLVDAGFDVNLVDNKQSPALHYAEDVEVVRILLDAGAEDLIRYDGHTAVSLACKGHRNTDILRLLLQRFPDSEHAHEFHLHRAVRKWNTEAVQELLAARPRRCVAKQDSLGRTALCLARDPPVVPLLLEADSGLLKVRDLKGRTAVMHLCCAFTHERALVELFRYCKEQGIDTEVNSRDDNGDTALHFAMAGSYHSVVELLLKNGAEVLGSGYEGTTVLMKPSLTKDFVTSTYEDIPLKDISRNDSIGTDEQASICLQMVLDAVLLYGGGGGPDGDADVEEATETIEPAAKRRKMMISK
jgi:ankyrin repeat protein